MKTIQCTHPPHHHNGFVATCLWTASGGVHTLLVLGPEITPYLDTFHAVYQTSNMKLQCFHQIKFIQLACAAKYGLPLYFNMLILSSLCKNCIN